VGGQRRGKNGRHDPAFISGTSSEFLGRKPLPRAARYRPLIFLLGPDGVGKTEVARKLLGEDVPHLSDVELREVVVRRVRRRRWDPELLSAPGLILDGPCFLNQRPGFASSIQALLKRRVKDGLRTVVIEAAAGGSTMELAASVSPDDRATLLLRFPIGRGRRRFALTVCEELGVDAVHARSVVTLEPWSYGRVRAVLRDIRDGLQAK
jgi:hypothetical protein